MIAGCPVYNSLLLTHEQPYFALVAVSEIS